MLGKIALGAVALTTAVGGGLAGVSAAEHSFDRGEQEGRKHHGPPQEIRTAIETNDFDAWLEAVTSREDSPLAEVASVELFDQMVTIHAIAESGDKEAAKEAHQALRAELGLPDKLEFRKNKRGDKPKFDKAVHEELREAMEERDYAVWAEVLIEEGVPSEHITEERFEQKIERFESGERRQHNKRGERSIQS